jgi:hypothetical protein
MLNFLKKLKQKKKNAITPVKDWYELIPVSGGDLSEPGHLAVRITQGPYKDLVIKYGAVSVKKDEEQKNKSTIRYEYDMIFIPKELEGKELTEEEEIIFHNFLGDVLSDIMTDAFSDQSKESVLQIVEEAEIKK